MSEKKKESAASKALRQLAKAGYGSGTLEARIAELIGDRDALLTTIEGAVVVKVEPAEQPAEQAEQHRFAIDREDRTEREALKVACDRLGLRPRQLWADHTESQWCFVVKPRARNRIKGAA
jgi:hypothetical protein